MDLPIRPSRVTVIIFKCSVARSSAVATTIPILPSNPSKTCYSISSRRTAAHSSGHASPSRHRTPSTRLVASYTAFSTSEECESKPDSTHELSRRAYLCSILLSVTFDEIRTKPNYNVGEPMNLGKKTKQYLPELDGLRAIAVSAVLFDHYFEDSFPSGFLGVDIFFVISGFVITKLLRQASFSNWPQYLFEFYARRIKRLLPALLFCVCLTSFLFLLLATRPSADVFKTGGLALIGMSNNFLFLRSTDYFSLDANLNPFTHTWSLGVEEQFYLLFPLVLGLAGFVAIGPKNRHRSASVLITLTALSFACYAFVFRLSESAAFYLIPTRFWELGLGALTYLIVERRSSNRRSSWHPTSALFLVLLCVLFLTPQHYQFLSTITSVLLTSAVLLTIRRDDLAYKLLTSKPFVVVGLLSYSLYLWHWSILVLGKWTIGTTVVAKAICLSLALAMSAFSYICIERPLRYRSWTKSHAGTVLVGLAVASLFGMITFIAAPHFGRSYNNFIPQLFDVKQVAPSGDIECHGREATSKHVNPLEHCLGVARSVSKPHVVYLIGDSHAAQMTFMAQEALADSRYSLRFINPEDPEDFPLGLIQNPPPANTRIIDFILRHAQLGDYVVIAFHRGHLNPIRDRHIPLAEEVSIDDKTKNFIGNMKIAIRQLLLLGVKVILIRDTPLMSVVSTSPACALQIRLFGESICRVSREQDLHTRHRQDVAFDRLVESFDRGVVAWDPLPLIYGQKKWLDVIDEHQEYVMSDWSHITRPQSESLAQDFRALIDLR